MPASPRLVSGRRSPTALIRQLTARRQRELRQQQGMEPRLRQLHPRTVEVSRVITPLFAFPSRSCSSNDGPTEHVTFSYHRRNGDSEETMNITLDRQWNPNSGGEQNQADAVPWAAGIPLFQGMLSLNLPPSPLTGYSRNMGNSLPASNQNSGSGRGNGTHLRTGNNQRNAHAPGNNGDGRRR